MAGVIKAREGVSTRHGGHVDEHGIHAREQRVVFDGSRDYSHEKNFARQRTRLHYSSTPLPAPFPPLAPRSAAAHAAAAVPPLLLPAGQAAVEEVPSGTSIGTAVSRSTRSIGSRPCDTLEHFRVHLPLGSPRSSHRFGARHPRRHSAATGRENACESETGNNKQNRVFLSSPEPSAEAMTTLRRRVLRKSCYGQLGWDRTNSATHNTAEETISRCSAPP